MSGKFIQRKLVEVPIEEAKETDKSEMDPDQLHHLMMMAVGEDNAQGLSRLIENYTNVWLDSPHSTSSEPMENAALAALLSPHGTRCIEVFNTFFGDLRNWKFGQHTCVHWTVAYKNEAGLAWALRTRRDDHKGYGRHSDCGLTLLDEETPSRLGGVGRSALSLAVISGDTNWLVRVLEISEEAGQSVDHLAREDKKSSISAIGVGLFALAERARTQKPTADGPIEAGIQACMKLLHDRGFPVDGLKPTIHIIAGMTWINAKESIENNHMQKIMQQAHDMGSGTSSTHRPATPFETAGFDLNLHWASALQACGFSDPEGAGFAMGIRRRLALDSADLNHLNFSWVQDVLGVKKAIKIAATLQKSPPPPGLDLLFGMEQDLLAWAIHRGTRISSKTSNATDEKMLAAAIGEKLALAKTIGLLPNGATRAALRM